MSTNTDAKSELDKIIKKLNDDLSSMRIGRASAMLVENILVEYYGTKVPLKQIANITVPDARLIIIEPWAKENLKDAIAAMAQANLGVNPITDGTAIKLAFPPLNQEEREKLVRLMRQRIEKAKVSMRLLREKEREEIKKKEKDKEIGKDEKFRAEKELQKIIDETMKSLEQIEEKKEKEIMTV